MNSVLFSGKFMMILETFPFKKLKVRSFWNWATSKQKKETSESSSGTITSPLPGTIYDIKVKTGDKVKEGQSLVKIIAMKMENNITAPKSGKIKEIKVKKNDTVNKGDILVIIE